MKEIKTIYQKIRWRLAKWWLNQHLGVEIIGITGSVGKTSTKESVAAVLRECFLVVKTSANFDPIFNLPLTALKIRGEEKLVAEMGVDGLGQMDKYLSLVQPRIGIVTKFSASHIDADHFGSIEKMIEEKSKLIQSLPAYGWAILNGDDEELRKLASQTKANVMLIGFSEGCDLRVVDFKEKMTGGKVHTQFTVDVGFEKVAFETKLLGKSGVMSALFGICVGMLMGMEFGEIQAGLNNLKPVRGRLEAKRSKWGVVIDDTYNASPEAVKNAIDVLSDLSDKGVLVLADMLELGTQSGRLHQEVGEYAAKKGIKTLMLMGEFANSVKRGFVKGGGREGEVFIGKTHESIANGLKEEKPDLILVKGSRRMKMERVVEEIERVA